MPTEAKFVQVLRHSALMHDAGTHPGSLHSPRAPCTHPELLDTAGNLTQPYVAASDTVQAVIASA